MLKMSVRFSTLALLGLLMPSCNKTTGTSDVPRGPVRTVIGTRTFTAGVREAAFVDVQVTGSGTLDAVANWTFSSNDVDLVATTTACLTTDQLLAGRCSELASTTSTTAKPERLSLTATTGTYRFVVFNWGPGGETGTIEVGLTQ
jgi:hypothetical protein